MNKILDAALQLSFPSDKELLIVRTFDAPRTLLFEVITKPEHVHNWYGPTSLTIKVCEIDLRVGGKWRYVLQAPDGSEYAFSGEYLEIVPPERLVSTEWYEAIPGADYIATVTLEEKDGKTTFTNLLRYRSKEHRDGHVASGMEPGMRESYGRLDDLLAEITTDRQIVISRTFDAPRELVWNIWTDPKHVDQWWGPDGFRNETFESNLRPGGMWRYMMHGPDGTDYPNRVVYQEVVAPTRLVYIHGSDVDNDPNTFHVTIAFVEHQKQTTVTMRSLFPTKAHKDAVIAFGAIEGGKQTLARLGEYLMNQRIN